VLAGPTTSLCATGSLKVFIRVPTVAKRLGKSWITREDFSRPVKSLKNIILKGRVRKMLGKKYLKCSFDSI